MNTNDIIEFKKQINNANIKTGLLSVQVEYELHNCNLIYTFYNTQHNKPAVQSFKKTYDNGETDILAAIIVNSNTSYSITLFENASTEAYKEYIDISSIDQYIFSTINNEDDVIFQMNATLSKTQVLICELFLLIQSLKQSDNDNNEYQ